MVGIPPAISSPAEPDTSQTLSLMVQTHPPLWSETAPAPTRIPLARAALILSVGGHQPTAALGGDMCESLLLTGAVSTALKYAVNRERPSGGGLSFPSGHTAAAFCIVPVLGHHLGWKIAVPAMIIASTTAAGRMEDMHHYLSDVVFGAAVGLACGDLISGEGFLRFGNARLVATPDRLGVSVPF